MVRSYYAHLLVRKQRVSGAGVLRITFCVTPVTKDYFNASNNSPIELWFHNAEFLLLLYTLLQKNFIII